MHIHFVHVHIHTNEQTTMYEVHIKESHFKDNFNYLNSGFLNYQHSKTCMPNNNVLQSMKNLSNLDLKLGMYTSHT